MIKLHQNMKKFTIVCDLEDLIGITVSLSESPVLENRKLAHALMEQVNELKEKKEGK